MTEGYDRERRLWYTVVGEKRKFYGCQQFGEMFPDEEMMRVYLEEGAEFTETAWIHTQGTVVYAISWNDGKFCVRWLTEGFEHARFYREYHVAFADFCELLSENGIEREWMNHQLSKDELDFDHLLEGNPARRESEEFGDFVKDTVLGD